MATFVIKPYYALPCEAETFLVNDQPAELEEFGQYEYDETDECDDEDILSWGCHGKYFKTKAYDDNLATVLQYCLTREEYNEICSTLESEFAIGTCGWCV